jgi:ectoine hydroxylase-related dioxygenase (phytanoyl-CoA dioxygenase family)
MNELAPTLVDQYHRDGYLFPLDLFNSNEVAGLLAEYSAAHDEARGHGFSQDGARYFRTNAHLVLPFVSAIARAPKLLDMVESILGHDLILWSGEFFVKDAKSPKIVSWHQDLTYWGLGETDEELTTWIALSDVNIRSGCMRFVPGSHKQRIQPHKDTFDDSNLLSRGQEIAVKVDESKAVDVVLKPGQVSFHHGRMFHASGPNTNDFPRIGLALRYITPNVKQLVAKRDYAMQLRGVDRSDHWIHLAPPSTNFQEQYLKLHQQVRLDQLDALAQGADQTLSTERE